MGAPNNTVVGWQRKGLGAPARSVAVVITSLSLLLLVIQALNWPHTPYVAVKVRASLQAEQQHGSAVSGDGPVNHPGSRTLAGTSVMFGAIGRDVANELPYVLANIARLASHFRSAHIVFVENNSQDDTRGVFKALGAAFTAGHSNRTAKLVSFESPSAKKNLHLLAEARNKYLEQLSLPEYAEVDFLIVVDTDMCWPWDIRNMVQIVNDLLPAAGSEWHALYANGACGWERDPLGPGKERVPPFTPGSINVYCDLFALRDTSGAVHQRDKANPNDIYLVPGTCDLSLMPKHSAATLACKQLRGHAVLPVQAAFGGWAMYEARMLRPSNTSTACRHSTTAGGCEHISLSQCLVREHNASQVIATGLVMDWEGCSEKEQHTWDGWQPRQSSTVA
ncbi:hypothetical protein COO60DRAFT_583369 [Scenedesmus sp. NREL 46B-D3]|nr:hypothetical protein COO60DRAFT_583369 [Scenedesmus sp. NREL 46B-D3]